MRLVRTILALVIAASLTLLPIGASTAGFMMGQAAGPCDRILELLLCGCEAATTTASEEAQSPAPDAASADAVR